MDNLTIACTRRLVSSNRLSDFRMPLRSSLPEAASRHRKSKPLWCVEEDEWALLVSLNVGKGPKERHRLARWMSR